MNEPGASRRWDTRARLQLAYDALNAAQVDRAHKLAQGVLSQAQAASDLQLQAQAMSLLAECERVLSRYRRSLDASQRAAHLFRLIGDVEGEIGALTLFARAASNLGRNEDAVEAALLSVRLAEMLPPGAAQVEAYNYLGVAYLWSRSWDRANAAFDAAVEAAAQCSCDVSDAQPRLNRLWAEMLRHCVERSHGGRTVSSDQHRTLAERFEAAFEGGPGRALSVSTQPALDCLWRTGLAVLCAWRGDLVRAAEQLKAARGIIADSPNNSVLHVYTDWADAELAWHAGNVAGAEHLIARMVRLATSMEHEQLACLGQLVASQIAEAQGKHAQALDELRRLNLRERLLRTESIDGRERVVQWQLDMRRSETSLQSLEIASRQLERLSLEDELTGIANRRCFERALGAMLNAAADGGSPTSVALIDVDGFKGVNDGFSHQVGDQVLKGIAGVLTASVREQDLAARLAGDEFVLAFRSTEATVSAQVCERIRAAVENYDWSAIAPGLRTSISIGVAQARPGDTVATLLHRSDMAMYAAKRAAAVPHRAVAA